VSWSACSHFVSRLVVLVAGVAVGRGGEDPEPPVPHESEAQDGGDPRAHQGEAGGVALRQHQRVHLPRARQEAAGHPARVVAQARLHRRLRPPAHGHTLPHEQPRT
jgi:hypothetical protein